MTTLQPSSQPSPSARAPPQWLPAALQPPGEMGGEMGRGVRRRSLQGSRGKEMQEKRDKLVWDLVES